MAQNNAGVLTGHIEICSKMALKSKVILFQLFYGISIFRTFLILMLYTLDESIYKGIHICRID